MRAHELAHNSNRRKTRADEVGASARRLGHHPTFLLTRNREGVGVAARRPAPVLFSSRVRGCWGSVGGPDRGVNLHRREMRGFGSPGGAEVDFCCWRTGRKEKQEQQAEPCGYK